MHRVTTIAQVRAEVRAARSRGARIAFVPTMGALHAGHLSLVRVGAEVGDHVVVSVFVNPTQFDRADDLAAYPRDLDLDEAALRGLGDATPTTLFSPPVEEMYPRPSRTTVHVAGLTDVLEGATRPGHFDGVTTVVSKLCNIIAPDVLVLGRKDAQQLHVVRRMLADLDSPVEVVDGPTVRDPDGVALSSRNQHLTSGQRSAAWALSGALAAAVDTARQQRANGVGPRAADVHAAGQAVLADAEGLEPDYLAVVDADTFEPPRDPIDAPCFVLVAARVGLVRLIDNVLVGDRADEDRILRAVERRESRS